MSTGFGVVLSGGVDAPWVARRAIAEHDPTLAPPLRDDLSLLVTELVSNAVLHGGAAGDRPVQVEFRREADRIRVEVIDPGTDFDRPPTSLNGNASGGWGLFLVDQIAERWGVSPAPAGTCVWFEVPANATA
jgi:anti-sigma regulatory factor (Ser/Thr protein kinase)